MNTLGAGYPKNLGRDLPVHVISISGLSLDWKIAGRGLPLPGGNSSCSKIVDVSVGVVRVNSPVVKDGLEAPVIRHGRGWQVGSLTSSFPGGGDRQVGTVWIVQSPKVPQIVASCLSVVTILVTFQENGHHSLGQKLQLCAQIRGPWGRDAVDHRSSCSLHARSWGRHTDTEEGPMIQVKRYDFLIHFQLFLPNVPLNSVNADLCIPDEEKVGMRVKMKGV